jgi:hypothetical protein
VVTTPSNGEVDASRCTIDDAKKRAVGFKLSEGMEVPRELDGTLKFARQKSKLAGTIRGSFFVIKGDIRAGLIVGRPAWARRTHVAG